MAEIIKLFEGNYRVQMPLLVSAGFKPATAEKITEKRLEEELSFDIYYDTSTGIACAGNEQDAFKILPYSEDLARVDEQTPLFIGGIERTAEQYRLLPGREFKRKDMILGKRLTEQEALNHEGWLASLNGNRNLLGRLVEHVFREVKNRYREDRAMAFCLRGSQEKSNIRALYLGRLYGGASGDCSLNDGLARLVGVRESAEGTLPKISVLPYTPKDVEAAERELTELSRFLQPERFASLEGLIKKLR